MFKIRICSIFLLTLLSSLSLLPNSFDFITYYKIDLIRRNDNFWGQGYTIGVLENGADHPVVNAQIAKRLFTGIQNPDHGNHVIGILVGRKLDDLGLEDFKGFDQQYDKFFNEKNFQAIIPTEHFWVSDTETQAIIPPMRTAKAQTKRTRGHPYEEALATRDQAINFIKQYPTHEEGLKAWKQQNGYHKRSKESVAQSLVSDTRDRSIFLASGLCGGV